MSSCVCKISFKSVQVCGGCCKMFRGLTFLGHSVQTGTSFDSQGHPRSLWMVPFDRRQNFIYFLFPGPHAYLASFWSYGEKNEISENESWLPWQRPLKIRKSRFRCSSTATAEPNGENRVKIHPVKVEIIGLTEIVKKE